jgi:phage terminase large subunit-like protein
LVFELPDAAERTLQRIRACPELGRLSTPDDLRRFADLFALFSGPSSSRCSLSLSDGSQADQRLAAALGARLRLAGGLPLALDEGSLILAAMESEGRDGSCRRREPSQTGQAAPPSRDVQLPGCGVAGFQSETGRIATFYPWDHPSLVGGETIAAIVPLGLQPIVDAHVETYNCYKAGGCVHHNTGKTIMGSFETTAHLIGDYHPWWPGRVFKRPVRAWACGKSNETTRDIVQKALLGDVLGSGPNKRLSGTGMVPGALIGKPRWKQGSPDLVDTVPIKHVTGGWSTLGMKSYEQGRGSFEGTAQDVIWPDEEAPMEVYMEMVTRTATTNGLVMTTFTALEGITEMVALFYPKET